jgi:hypothetical protein
MCPLDASRASHTDTRTRRRLRLHFLKMATCVAKSVVFASAARPNNKAGNAAKPARHASKLWTPSAVGLNSPGPTIIVEGDAASKMAGLTAHRREVIMDMEHFAETEVRADCFAMGVHAHTPKHTPSSSPNDPRGNPGRK